ncbi:glycosyltransferase family 4 protein [Sulfuricystis multivorans]|uniref:glycosyltransferase family 4 protein n=1 Tax=Sulfuricystis multivorans TaxID=2211108 RepID=UPI000F84E0FF|nr:glycosyltransferase family 1 protein [Sulfuricystis multivorans]
MSARKLRLALVSETFPPEVNGVAMTLGRLAEGLRSRGHAVSIVRPRQKDEVSATLPDGGLLVPGLPIPRYPELRFGLPAARRLISLWRTAMPDVVHVATEGPLGHSALAAARRLGIPTISSFHTNFHSYSRHYGIGWLQRGIESYLRWFHNRTAMILVPTASLAMALGQAGFGNVRVLSRGVDTRLFSPARRSPLLRLEWGARPDAPVCLVVSRLAPEKNLALAFKAFTAIRQEWPQARMVCVGDGPAALALARRYPDVLFCGMRTGEDLATHYASADLFLFPSLTETFGNVVAESLASGLPVVAFDHAAAGELIVEGVNGWLVKPGDTVGFIAASREAVRRLTRNGIDRAGCAASVRHLSWNSVVERYETMLIDAVEHRFDAADAVLPAPTFEI